MTSMPKCTGELVISPNICDRGDWEGPVHPVPIPGTLPLLLIGVVLMKMCKRRGA